MKLAVELYGAIIGYLEGSDARTFDFVADDEAAATFGLNSRILSVLMPLTPVAPRQHAGRRRNWFAELLPEGDQLDHMLVQGGIRRGDIPSFLAPYGRDVAGALQIWDVDTTIVSATTIAESGCAAMRGCDHGADHSSSR